MKKLIATGLGAILSLSSCTSVPATKKAASECAVGSIEVTCILRATERSLALVADDADWISSKVEFAKALSANDQKSEALKHLKQAQGRITSLDDPLTQATMLSQLGKAYVEAGFKAEARAVIKEAAPFISQIETLEKRSDTAGKFYALQAASGDVESAIKLVADMSEVSGNSAAFKARTYKEIAETQAKSGDIAGAQKTVDLMTMGLTYYKATALSHIAETAFTAGDKPTGAELLATAETIARAQDDGYFVAGALREIGKAHLTQGNQTAAITFFEDAKKGARQGKTKQHQARALSRIGTGLADRGLFERAASVFPESIALAEQETSKVMQPYAYYEIAGSAAFAGEFETALGLLERIPTTEFVDANSLRDAAKRDIAWGYAKHGRTEEALEIANSIVTPREKVQALSRIVRILQDPKMQTLPRYL